MVDGAARREVAGSAGSLHSAIPVALVGAGTLVVLLPILGADPVRLAAGLSGLVVAIAVTARLRSAPATRALLVLAALLVVFAAGRLLDVPPAVTTVASCVVPVLVLAGCDRTRWLRPALPWFRTGRVSGPMLLFALA